MSVRTHSSLREPVAGLATILRWQLPTCVFAVLLLVLLLTHQDGVEAPLAGLSTGVGVVVLATLAALLVPAGSRSGA